MEVCACSVWYDFSVTVKYSNTIAYQCELSRTEPAVLPATYQDLFIHSMLKSRDFFCSNLTHGCVSSVYCSKCYIVVMTTLIYELDLSSHTVSTTNRPSVSTSVVNKNGCKWFTLCAMIILLLLFSLIQPQQLWLSQTYHGMDLLVLSGLVGWRISLYWILLVHRCWTAS